MKTVQGQPSWRLTSREVEAYITQQGGHLAPVTFDRSNRKFRPYSVAPWCEEKLPASVPPLLKALRGDFFCMPFGMNAERFRGEQHPVHGETAQSRWELKSLQDGHLHASLRTRVRRGRVEKHILLRDGHHAVYSQHVISGMSGPMNLGHHATLKFPEEDGSGVISTGRFVYGLVFPGAFERAEERGYQALKPGAEFSSLERVPMISGETTDLTRYPARRGYEDLAMVVSDADAAFGWTAVTFPKQRYVWFALKNPRVLRNTLFWISNGGRHYPPWNGRHVSVMGLEEITSYFHCGLAASARPNPLSQRGYPTSLSLHAQRPTVINYIMAATAIPAGFDRVAAIEAGDSQQSVSLRSVSGKVVQATVDVGFLEREESL